MSKLKEIVKRICKQENEDLISELENENIELRNKIKSLENTLENLEWEYSQTASSLESSNKCIEKISSGEWVVLKTDEEKAEALDHAGAVKKAYKEIQDVIDKAERDSGICYDALSDDYYERYNHLMSEELRAAIRGFKMEDRLCPEELLKESKSLKERLTDDQLFYEEAMIKECNTVKTNIGELPIEDYRDIIAIQNGFDDYEDLHEQGFCIEDAINEASDEDGTANTGNKWTFKEDMAEEIDGNGDIEENHYEQEVNECNFNNIHKNINFKVVRHRDVTKADEDLYESMKSALTIANNFVKETERVLRNKNVSGDSELAVALLIDQSGSMSGDRIEYARITSVILQRFCKSYNIPIHIAGHNANYSGTVQYDVYADFDDFDNKDKFRIMQIYSGGCNRDGAALQFCGEHLLKRPEEKKLLILISDGQPSDYNYSGGLAKQDLKAIKRNLKNKGIESFVAAVGSDKEFIKEIYSDNFLDISELKNLPRNLVRVVEKFMEL